MKNKSNVVICFIIFSVLHSVINHTLASSDVPEISLELPVQEQVEKTGDMSSTPTVLVFGATGATGRLLVRRLLHLNYHVSTIVRSKERMLALLDDKAKTNADLLTITEAPSLLKDGLTDEDFKRHVDSADIIVSCLGHTPDIQGLWGHPKRLVTDTVRRLDTAISKQEKPKKFILMASDGVANPEKTDEVRPSSERAILWILRKVMSPHADNEEAVEFLYHNFPSQQTEANTALSDRLEWVVVRPTGLTDDTNCKYKIYDGPVGKLFGSGTTSRASVAQFMADLIANDNIWNNYKYKMPVVHDAKVNGGGDNQKNELLKNGFASISGLFFSDSYSTHMNV